MLRNCQFGDHEFIVTPVLLVMELSPKRHLECKGRVERRIDAALGFCQNHVGSEVQSTDKGVTEMTGHGILAG